MPFRKRKARRTIGKDARRMTQIILDNLVVGVPQDVIIVEPTQGTGVSGTGDVFENADTEKICSTNALIKYFNIRLQCSMKPETAPANPGWLEYAVVLRDEIEGTPAINSGISTNLGVSTLGDICVNLYRGKCLWNDAIPISTELPTVTNVKLKIPAKWCKQLRGMWWTLLLAYRSNNSTDVTTTVRCITQTQFKVYS